SLDELETGLDALLSQSLPEHILGLDTIQQAKLQVVIPYLVYDLVFVYLKTKGLDPKTHPVVTELERVRQYFDKIKDAEDPAKRQFAIDRAAATRFIKHAIAQVKDAPLAPTSDSGPTTARVSSNADDPAATAPVLVPVKVTEKMLEREQYQQTLREEDREEETEDLKVIDGGEDDGERPSDNPPGQASGVLPLAAKGESKAPSETSVGKRRRQAFTLLQVCALSPGSLPILPLTFPSVCLLGYGEDPRI
ncbi:hypothetical protein EI94DRAFT_1564974, partial [Lactarius quietus]